MTQILITGAAGVLGRAVMNRFRQIGVASIGLRRPGRGAPDGGAWLEGDLQNPDSVARFMPAINVVVHCATKSGTKGADVIATSHLLSAGSNLSHFVYVGIAGIEDAARTFGYYQDKLDCESLIANSGVPYTIVRATQFHELVDTILASSQRGPLQLLPVMKLQPVDTLYVAERLVSHAQADPAQRVPDIHGPEILTARELFQTRQLARRTKLVAVQLPGIGMAGLFGRLRSVSGDEGGRTWAQWLAS